MELLFYHRHINSVSNKPHVVLFCIHIMLLSSQNIINVSHNNNMQVAILSAPSVNIIFDDKSLLLMKMGLFITGIKNDGIVHKITLYSNRICYCQLYHFLN